VNASGGVIRKLKKKSYDDGVTEKKNTVANGAPPNAEKDALRTSAGRKRTVPKQSGQK